MICSGWNDGGWRSATSLRARRADATPQPVAEVVGFGVVRQSFLGGERQVLFGERPVVLEALVQREQVHVELEPARPHGSDNSLERWRRRPRFPAGDD